MGGVMSPEEAEAQSPYNQYTPPGHIEGSTPSQWEIDNQFVSPSSNPNDATSQKLVSGAYAQTAQQQAQYQRVQDWRQQQEQQRVQQQQAQARKAADVAINPYGGVGSGDYSPTRADMLANPFNRADIYKVTDSKQRALMDTGLTAGQAAEKLRYEAQQKGDYAGQRKYETLLTQAWTTETGKSAAYHYAAKESGLPQAANPYEFGADLFTYAMKGYPQRSKDRFSPVDYTTLGLPEGKGQQAFTWGNQPYDLRGAMDRVASAQRSGEMGVYGQVGAFSSAFGALSLADQQAIGQKVNANPVNQAKGFITKDTMGGFTDTVRNMDRGTFVPSLGNYSSPMDKKPFISYQANVETRYLPSAATQAAMDMWGGENSNPIARGMVGVFDFFSPKTVTKSGKGSPVDRQTIFNWGGATFTQKFIGADNKPTDVMDFKKGNPYLKNGQTYQDYEHVDLSKTRYTPLWTTTTSAPSGFDMLRGSGSDYVYKTTGGLFGLTGSEMEKAVTFNRDLTTGLANANPTPQNLINAFAWGAVKDTMDRPIEGAAVLAISALSGGIYGGIEKAGAWAVPQIATKAPLLAKGLVTGWKVMPYAFGAVYAGQASYRVTEGFSDFKPGNVSSRMGGMFATETVPMVVGFSAGYKAPELILGKKVDLGYYPIDNTRVASGGMFEQYRPSIDATELASGGHFRSTAYGGPAFVKTGTVREGGIFGDGGLYLRARGQFRDMLEAPVSTATGGKKPSFDNSAGTMAFGGVRSKYGVNPQTGMYEMPSAKTIFDYPGGAGGRVRTSYKYDFYPERPQVDYGAMFPGRPLSAPKPTTHSFQFGYIRTADVTPTKVVARIGHDTPMNEMWFFSAYAGTPKTSERVTGIPSPLSGMYSIAKEAARSEVMPAAYSQSFANIRNEFSRAQSLTRGKVTPAFMSAGILGTSAARSNPDVNATSFSIPGIGSGTLSRTSGMPDILPRTGVRSLSRTYPDYLARTGSGSSTVLPLVFPSLGLGGLGGFGGKGKRGRKFGERFTTDFGDITQALFGTPQRKTATRRKKKRKQR